MATTTWAWPSSTPLQQSTRGQPSSTARSAVSERERAVFILRHYHDLKLKEIAQTLGISLGSAKSYLFRSLRKLQEELADAELASDRETSHEKMSLLAKQDSRGDLDLDAKPLDRHLAGCKSCAGSTEIAATVRKFEARPTPRSRPRTGKIMGIAPGGWRTEESAKPAPRVPVTLGLRRGRGLRDFGSSSATFSARATRR
jgi:hypothetical protein